MSEHRAQVHLGIAQGLAGLLVAGALAWWLLPGAGARDTAYWMPWLLLYSLPLQFAVLLVVLRRYGSPDLISGAASSSEGLDLERAVLQNTLEQTVIALPLVLAFGALAPAAWLKGVPVHAIVFVLARALFYLGYRADPLKRIPGFVMTNYANLLLALAILYLWLFR